MISSRKNCNKSQPAQNKPTAEEQALKILERYPYEPIEEELKVNDKLTLKINVFNMHGEKYVMKDVYTKDIFDEMHINCLCGISYSGSTLRRDEVFKLLIAEYANSISDLINHEYVFPSLYRGYDSFDLWTIWNKRTWIHEIINNYRDRYNMREIMNTYNSSYIIEDTVTVQTEDIMFPFIMFSDRHYDEKITSNIEQSKQTSYKMSIPSTTEYEKDVNCTYFNMIHFDILIFMLYVKYPQYKNDLIRFLKYQPVCTLDTDELYIHNLKQTNKDLLKQLNEANHKLQIIEKTEAIKRNEIEAKLSETTNELNTVKEQLSELNTENTNLKNKLSNKRIENLHLQSENTSLKELESKLNDVEATLANRTAELEQTKDELKHKCDEVQALQNKLDAITKCMKKLCE